MASTSIDLCANEKKAQSIECDVCIVGAGAAGAYLACQLARRGKNVVVLEAGDEKGTSAVSAGFMPEFLNNYYPGAVEGRSFGIGGSTSRWGGLLAPHSANDFECEPVDEDRSAAWRHIVDVVSANQTKVLSALGYLNEPDFDGFANIHLSKKDRCAFHQAGIAVVASLFLPIRRKNLSFLLFQSHMKSVRVFRNAVVNNWEIGKTDKASIVRSVTAVSRNHRTVQVLAKSYVVAAGTIETTRVLLEIASSTYGPSLSPEIGRFLGDHLSIPIADVVDRDLKRTTSAFAPRFDGPWMRSFRFIVSSRKKAQSRSFAHFIFDIDNSGFKVAKSVLAALQARRWPNVSATEVALGIGGVCRLGASRYLLSRLHVPSRTRTRLQLDIEQQPSAQNRIRLGTSCDQFDRRIAQIDWRISDSDMDQVRSASCELLKRWRESDLPELAVRDIGAEAEKPHDAYHPVGTCRIGRDDLAVVDFDLRVNGTENLYAATTGVLPTAGTANPTFTLLCLAHGLSTRLP